MDKDRDPGPTRFASDVVDLALVVLATVMALLLIL